MTMQALLNETIDSDQDRSLVEPAITTHARKPRRKRRNYWARLNAADFVSYPKYKPLSYLAEMRLIRLAQQGDLAARNQVWVRNVRLAFSVVNQYSVPTHLLADAIQEGLVGLHRAIEKFDITRYFAFSTYAWYWISQRVRRFLKFNRYSVPIPAHLHSDYHTFRQQISNCNGPREREEMLERWKENQPSSPEMLMRLHALATPIPLHQLPRTEYPATTLDLASLHDNLSGAVQQVLSVLNERQQQVIIWRYGLMGHAPMTLEEIGAVMGITRERVRQIQAAAERNAYNRLAALRALFSDSTCAPNQPAPTH